MVNSQKAKENDKERRGKTADPCCDDSCCGGRPSVSVEGGGCC